MGWRDFDVEDFFDDAYALEAYVEGPPSDETVAGLEAELGYRFPASYVDFARLHNGGMPNYTCFPTSQRNRSLPDRFRSP